MELIEWLLVIIVYSAVLYYIYHTRCKLIGHKLGLQKDSNYYHEWDGRLVGVMEIRAIDPTILHFHVCECQRCHHLILVDNHWQETGE